MLRGILVFWLLSLLVVVWLLYLLDVHMPVLTRVLRYIVNGMKEMAQNE
ncbi:hypothetical protein ACRZTK_004411 [Enterobacter asburiae]